MARNYIGVPFKYYGRDRKGIDCVNLIATCFEGATGKVLALPPYDKSATSSLMIGALSKLAHRIPLNELEVSDLILFNYQGRSTHIGIYSGEGRVIHSFAQERRVCELPLSHPNVKDYIVAAYRLFGLEEIN